MSINLGRLCANGALILADTHSYLRDGTARKDGKILRFDGKKIAFAIADASDDANAAKTLLSTIGPRLANEAEKWRDVEKIIKDEMTEWHKAFRKPPATVFTGALMLKGDNPTVRLYTMEPPRTLCCELGGYVANGAGCWIADLLFDILDMPNPSAHPQTALRECAYLLYRVDKANVYCRGIDGYFLDLKRQTLRHLDVVELKWAIKVGFQLDIVLSTATLVTLGTEGKWFAHNVSSVGAAIEKCDKLRKLIFHDVAGNEIEC